MGYSEVTKAQSRMAMMASLKRMSVHIALPWVMMGSSSSPLPSQQSSSTHLWGKDGLRGCAWVMGWVVLGWRGEEWDGLGWDRKGRKGLSWDGIRRVGLGWDRK